MKSKQVFYGLLAAVVILFGLASFGTLYGGKILQKKGDELYALKLEKAQVDAKEDDFERAKKDVKAYTDLESIARSIVPQEKDQARTIREIVSLADEAGISLTALQFPSSVLGGAATTPTAAGIKPTAPAIVPNISQLTPVLGIKGVYAMQITVQSDVDKLARYSQMLDFLTKLENNRRTANVTNISIQPSEKDRNLVSFTLIVNVYIKP